MKVVKLADALNKPAIRSLMIEGMRNGAIFVYPTDTLYGLGCNAEIGESVDKITEAKGRDAGKKSSVIAPSKDWIWKHTTLSRINMKFADALLPGPYTIIMKAKKSAPKPAVSGGGSMGVRLPKHPFSRLIADAGVPFLSTSVNLSGKEPAANIADIPASVKGITDWAIDARKIYGPASRVFDLRTDSISVLRY
jgi:L-threonylcarbamoyladenylate synthase